MPEDYKDYKMLVLCNECHSKSLVPFHVLNGKCSSCQSYNTTKIDSCLKPNKIDEK